MLTTIDKFGRIVIPKKIRDHFNLSAGAHVKIESTEEGIVLKPIVDEPKLRWKEGVLVFSGDAAGDMRNAVEKHREKVLSRISIAVHPMQCREGQSSRLYFSPFLYEGQKET